MSDIGRWLDEHALGKYTELFVENEIDFDVLEHITLDELEKLGMPLGARKRLQNAVATLSEAQAAPANERPVRSEQPEPATGEAERRQLTVMFCDLVGSTELSQKLDAEELREVNRAFQDACKFAIERYDGYVARYMGDGVLAYFGYPQAHEDDVERAIHAGLGVVESVAALDSPAGEGPGIDVDVRVGIATGPVVVGDLIGKGPSQESAVVGETPNLAARLQGLAAPNAVVISPNTQALAAGRFEYEDLGHHALKGIAAPVRTWRVISPSSAESRFDAAHRAELTPLVGREQEIELLLKRWQHAKEGDGQVVLLSGEGGIGKSRIVESLRERTARDEPIRFRYQCSPYHTSSALHPFIAQLERAACFVAEDSDENKLDKLERLLAAGTREVDTAASLVASLLSIPSGTRYARLEMSPERQKGQTLEALVAQLEGLSRTRPVLIIFEDAHWADPTSLDLLELTVSRAQKLPALVVITFRPEFDPPWMGYTHFTSLTLNRFTRKLAAAMVNEVTGGKALPERVLEQIIDKTDGVPLFVEELTKTILESGLLLEESDRYMLSGPLADVTIPVTLHDSLMARLDRLGPAKEVAQTASAIGREFDYDLLAAVSRLGSTDLRDALSQLIDAELVFHHGRSQDDRYFFKHALVQDAAYESLLTRKGREIHARIAEVLESRFPDRAQREPELLARHFTEAKLPDKAAPYWREAGKLASSRSAYAEAAHHFTQGLQVLGTGSDNAEQHRAVLEMQIGLADSLAWWKGFAASEVEAAYRRARELCTQIGEVPELFGILWGLWHFFDIKGNLEAALELARELRELADASHSAGRRSQAHRALGETFLWRGEFTQAREETERGMAVYGLGEDSIVPGGEDPAVANRDMHATALWCLGYPDKALQRVTEALEFANASENAGDRGIALTFMGWLHLLRREAEPARDWSEQLLDFSSERGMNFFEVFAKVHRGAALALLGSREGAAEIAAGVDINDEIGANLISPWFLCLLAEAHLEAGKAVDALAVLEKANRFVEESKGRWLLADVYRLQGTALLQTNDPMGAEARLDRAVRVAREQKAKSFELRACTNLARLWRDQGKPQVAHDLLLPVFDWFTEGFGTPDLLGAKTLLNELSRR